MERMDVGGMTKRMYMREERGRGRSTMRKKDRVRESVWLRGVWICATIGMHGGLCINHLWRNGNVLLNTE